MKLNRYLKVICKKKLRLRNLHKETWSSHKQNHMRKKYLSKTKRNPRGFKKRKKRRNLPQERQPSNRNYPIQSLSQMKKKKMKKKIQQHPAIRKAKKAYSRSNQIKGSSLFLEIGEKNYKPNSKNKATQRQSITGTTINYLRFQLASSQRSLESQNHLKMRFGLWLCLFIQQRQNIIWGKFKASIKKATDSQ